MSSSGVAEAPPDIYEMVRVEQIDSELFVGRVLCGPYRRIFGGQLIGQAVMAAMLTVGVDRPAHSYRCSFLRMGDVDAPVVYRVERLRDGRTVSVREVRAMQGERVLMVATVSFHGEQGGVRHQRVAPKYPQPEKIDEKALVVSHDLLAFEPPHRKAVVLKRVPRVGPGESEDGVLRGGTWFRPALAVGRPDARVRRAVLALCSDYTILEAVVLGHDLSFADPRYTIASLDHGFWWHGDPAFDDWLLLVQESPWAGDQRTLVHGHIYSRVGELLGSIAQEGLVRVNDAD